MIDLMADVLGSLAALHDSFVALKKAAAIYQRALVAAKQQGASYPQLAEALGVSESGARWRCKSAVEGGEVHLSLDPVRLLAIPEPRKEASE